MLRTFLLKLSKLHTDIRPKSTGPRRGEITWNSGLPESVSFKYLLALIMDAERIEELTGRPDKAFRADPKAPFTTIQRAAVIEGVHTEFILTSYSNMIFFVITQNEKLGSIVRTTLLTTPFGSLSTVCSIYRFKIHIYIYIY